jgi:CBS-domain-containing membrane protein
MASPFLSLHRSDFSFLVVPVQGQSPIFLLLLLIVEPVRRQAIAKLLSTSQSSFTNKASGLRADDGEMEVEVTSDPSGEHKITDESTLTLDAKKGLHKAHEDQT